MLERVSVNRYSLFRTRRWRKFRSGPSLRRPCVRLRSCLRMRFGTLFEHAVVMLASLFRGLNLSEWSPELEWDVRSIRDEVDAPAAR